MIRYEMQRLTGFVGLLIFLVVCSVCRREEKKVSSNQIVIGQITSAVSLDPHLVNEESTHSTLTHFYSKLVTFGPEMDLQPDLAVRWESLSETVWRLQLREGVVFHDGRSFEAQDVVASILRAQNLGSYDVQSIKHVYAVDRQTVEVQTYDPFPVLLNKLASVYIVPRNTGLTPIKRPLGTGPYRFVSGVPNGTI
ncbi:ABC transporter substrate-binding protein [bacterium]|nr:ABC transporter substrate-binding protein [bacterium]